MLFSCLPSIRGSLKGRGIACSGFRLLNVVKFSITSIKIDFLIALLFLFGFESNYFSYTSFHRSPSSGGHSLGGILS